MNRGDYGIQSMGLQRIRYNWAHTYIQQLQTCIANLEEEGSQVGFLFVWFMLCFKCSLDPVWRFWLETGQFPFLSHRVHSPPTSLLGLTHSQLLYIQSSHPRARGWATRASPAPRVLHNYPNRQIHKEPRNLAFPAYITACSPRCHYSALGTNSCIESLEEQR